MKTDDALAARYGRTPRTRRLRVVVAAAVGAAVLATAVVWVVWVGLLGPSGAFEARDTGYAVNADESVEVRFDVTTEPGTTVSCALQALDSSFGIVGWKVVEIPPSTERTRSFAVEVRTAATPTTGLIYRCWLT